MSDNRMQLSRRKLLAGATAVGTAGLGAGFGTSALFSDEESFENNSLTAGNLDMSVTASLEGANEYWADRIDDDQTNYVHAIEDISETADGGITAGLSVEDVKPGDWAIICFEIEVSDNPGYVQVSTANLESYENGYEEPEPEVSEDEGELENHMLALVYGSLSGAGVAPNNDANPPKSYLNNSSLDSTTPSDSTVQDTYNVYNTGVLLRNENGDPLEVGSGDHAATWYLLLELPSETGNVVQGDGFKFDLKFHAEQARHNDNPFQTQRIELGPKAAQHTGFQAQSGDGYLGSGYWTDDPTQQNSDGTDDEQLYVSFDQGFGPYYVDSLATFTVGDIESVRYRTRRPPGAAQDYFMEIFTFTDGTNDDASWYGRQLQALPADALNKNVSTNSWLTWQTDQGTNQLTFYDYNHDYDTTDTNSPPYLGQETGVTLADLQSTGSFDWSDYVASADSTHKNYRDEEVRAFRFATGSAWEDTHEGDLDAIEIELSDGRRAVIDLED